MTTQWRATVQVQMPTAATSFVAGRGHVPVTAGRNVIVTVPDSGGYFGTKALLESSYGRGNVVALHPAN
jgi:hypothetical protein